MVEPDRMEVGRRVLGLRLRELRNGSGLSLAQAAGRADLSLSYLSDLERGRRLPSLEVLHALGEVLGVLVSELLQDVYPWGDRTPPGLLDPPPDARRNPPGDPR